MFRMLLLCLLLVVAAMPARAQSSFTPAQTQELEKLVREILIRNPQILVEAMQALDEQQDLRRAEAAAAAIKERKKEIVEDAASHAFGNLKGDVVLVEFFDYRCPYCKQVQPSVKALANEDKNLRIVLKELPVLGPESVTASRAAIAALRLQKDKYLAFHDAMMEFRGELDEAAVFRIAAASGLDVAKLKQGMAAPEVEAIIQRNLDLAHALGIEGTPGFVIGDKLIPGALPLEALRQVIAEQRKK